MTKFYNDGGKGTGTEDEMAIVERRRLATEGVIVASVNVHRPPNARSLLEQARTSGEPKGGLRARVRLTSRGMWTNKGSFTREMCGVAQRAVAECAFDAALGAVERAVRTHLRKAVRYAYCLISVCSLDVRVFVVSAQD